MTLKQALQETLLTIVLYQNGQYIGEGDFSTTDQLFATAQKLNANAIGICVRGKEYLFSVIPQSKIWAPSRAI